MTREQIEARIRENEEENERLREELKKPPNEVWGVVTPVGGLGHYLYKSAKEAIDYAGTDATVVHYVREYREWWGCKQKDNVPTIHKCRSAAEAWSRRLGKGKVIRLIEVA